MTAAEHVGPIDWTLTRPDGSPVVTVVDGRMPDALILARAIDPAAPDVRPLAAELLPALDRLRVAGYAITKTGPAS